MACGDGAAGIDAVEAYRRLDPFAGEESPIELIRALDAALGTSTSLTALESERAVLADHIEAVMSQFPQIAATVRWLEQQYEWLQATPLLGSPDPAGAPEALDKGQILAEVERFLRGQQPGTGHMSGGVTHE